MGSRQVRRLRPRLRGSTALSGRRSGRRSLRQAQCTHPTMRVARRASTGSSQTLGLARTNWSANAPEYFEEAHLKSKELRALDRQCIVLGT